jgi:DNA-binding NarL/FixJ family response regulator
LELLARGFLYKEIAEELKMSVPTVNTHIRHIYEKLHVQSRGQAVAIYANLEVTEAEFLGFAGGNALSARTLSYHVAA